jgi:hypothetical protein
MKDFFKIRTTVPQLAEEHGAGEQGTPALVSKYKNATPGQGPGCGPSGQQPARKGDKLNAKFEPVKESAGAYEKDMDPKKPVYAQGVKGAKSTPFKKKFSNMKAYDKWSDSDAAGDFDVQRVFQESVDEGINKDDPIAKEYSALMKKSIGDLRAMIKQQKKVVDVSGYTSKDQAASEILRAKHGNKKVAAAMGLDEGIMGKLKSFKRGMDARSKAADHFDKAGDPKNPNASKDLRRAVKYHNVVNKEETEGEDSKRTGITEQKHRIQVTVSEPDHPSVAARKTTKQKFVKLSAATNDEAVKKAKAFYKKQGYKIHGAEHVSMVEGTAVTEGENKQIKGGDPCWDNYKMVGTKKKGGKTVPNCVPANEGLKPGWMLKADPKLGAAVKAKQDMAKKRQATYGNPAAGKSAVKESLKSDVKALRTMIEEASYKVDVEGLPTMYVQSKSPTEVRANLRKLLKKADMILSVDRIPDVEVKKAFRLKAMGKDEE